MMHVERKTVADLEGISRWFRRHALNDVTRRGSRAHSIVETSRRAECRTCNEVLEITEPEGEPRWPHLRAGTEASTTRTTIC